MTDLITELRADLYDFPWSFNGAWQNVSIDASVMFDPFAREQSERVVAAYANTVPVRSGGSHAKAIHRAVARALAGLERTESSQRAWSGAISIRMPETELKFLGPTKDLLAVPGLEEGLSDVMWPSLREHILARQVAYEPWKKK